MRRIVLVAAAVIWLPGCSPPPGLGRAQTLAPGKGVVHAGLDLAVIAPKYYEDAKVPWATISGGYRRGVTESFDAGARAWIFGLKPLWTWGVAVDGRWQLKRSARAHSGTDVTVAVIGEYGQVRLGGYPYHTGRVTVPLYVGHRWGRHQFFWGPRVGWQVIAGEGMNALDSPLLGLGLGCAFKWGGVDVVPELVSDYSSLRLGGEVVDPDREQGAVSTQLSVGVVW